MGLPVVCRAVRNGDDCFGKQSETGNPDARRLPWFAISLLFAVAMVGAYLLQRAPSMYEIWVRLFHIDFRRFGWPLDILAGGAASAALLAMTGA